MKKIYLILLLALPCAMTWALAQDCSGCSGAPLLTNTSGAVTIDGTSYCDTGTVSIGSLDIMGNGGVLVIQANSTLNITDTPGVVLESSGGYIEVCDGAKLIINKALTLNTGNSIVLNSGAYMLTESTNSTISGTISMDKNSILEICGGSTNIPSNNRLLYTGTTGASDQSYFIVRGAVINTKSVASSNHIKWDDFYGNTPPVTENANFCAHADTSSCAANERSMGLSSTCGSGQQLQSALLPVFWVHLSGLPEGKGIRLSWEVVHDVPSVTFYIQRSDDAQKFGTAGQLTGTGFVGQPKNYSYMDYVLPQANAAYYRILAMGSGYETKYSQVIRVNLDGSKTNQIFRILPNPSASTSAQLELYIGLHSPHVLSVTDLNGKVMEQLKLPSGLTPNSTIDLGAQASLRSGYYLVTLKDESGNVIGTEKLLIQ